MSKRFKERPNLNKVAEEVYEINRLRGFHTKEYSEEHFLMLVITEISEAVNSDRKNKKSRLKDFNEYMDGSAKTIFINEYLFSFREYIYDTFEDELADIIIRLLDLAASRKIDLNVSHLKKQTLVHLNNHKPHKLSAYNTITENLLIVVDILRNPHYNLAFNIERGIKAIEAFSSYLHIDIWLYVELKIKFNSFQENTNGKKY